MSKACSFIIQRIQNNQISIFIFNFFNAFSFSLFVSKGKSHQYLSICFFLSQFALKYLCSFSSSSVKSHSVFFIFSVDNIYRCIICNGCSHYSNISNRHYSHMPHTFPAAEVTFISLIPLMFSSMEPALKQSNLCSPVCTILLQWQNPFYPKNDYQ